MNIYFQLTQRFNQGRRRALLSSGQAVVYYQLAMMSKDGDWILREDGESMDFILGVLEEHGARYRFGAPLDLRWMRGGWSSHFEFRHSGMRIRTDFVTRPPRISEADLERMWDSSSREEFPVIDLRALADIKKTNREKDYAIIGDLARRMDSVRDQLLFSRSARDLIRLAEEEPELVRELKEERGVLAVVAKGRDELEVALDAERRSLMRANEHRLERYLAVSGKWRAEWNETVAETRFLDLREAHRVIVRKAAELLPTRPGEDSL